MTRPPARPRTSPETRAETDSVARPDSTVRPDGPESESLTSAPDALSPEGISTEPPEAGRVGVPGTWAGRLHALNRLPLTLMMTSVLLGLGIVQLTFQLGNIAYRSVTWRQETQATQARVNNLQRDVNTLRDAERSASDPAYLEQLARCQGFVRRSEMLVVSPKAPTTPGENCQVVRLP